MQLQERKQTLDTKSNERTIRLSIDNGKLLSTNDMPDGSTVKLFVYGIFLDELNRQHYGMENPSYDTVPGFITIGDYIVQAIPSSIMGVALTGLLVDVPTNKLQQLDMLELRYSRIKVNTTYGFEAYMYAAHGSGDNYSTIRSTFHESKSEEQFNLSF